MAIITDEMMKKAGLHHPNPSVRHGRELAMKELGRGEAKHGAGEHGHEKDVEEHGPIHEANVESKGGKHTVVAHHEDGHVGRHEHDSLESAHAQHAAMMGEGSGASHDQSGDTQYGDNDDQGQDQNQDQDETCPSCGGEMKNGKCETCGYKADDADDEAPEEDEE